MSKNPDKLIRLPDGTWVRPSALVAVRATATLFPPGVYIEMRWGDSFFIEADSAEAARDLCDKIGHMLADAEDDQEEDA